MPSSVLTDKEIIPDDELLNESLGNTYSIYKSLFEYLYEKYSDIKPEWKHYGKNIGWNLKVFYKKRNLFFLFPCSGYFKISFVFGKKAIEEIEKSDLPDSIKTDLRNAKQYAEGKGIQLEVKSKNILNNLKKLISIKIDI
jgi:hypothetical protein